MQEAPDPTESDSVETAVFIGQQVTGTTIIIGREDKNEWLTTDTMQPLDLEEYR